MRRAWRSSRRKLRCLTNSDASRLSFFGACFIQNHIMCVMEFAVCGSLADCIKKQPEPEERIKVKLVLDGAKGLSYLHSNWILHRDIKLDNILVFSLDEVIEVNGKLTDFGSSRNINMLMTNMTFTKGIGSPTYMAPEVLCKEKYKKAADVFSFGVAMFECMKWGEAKPKVLFKYLLKISMFVRKIAKPEMGNKMSSWSKVLGARNKGENRFTSKEMTFGKTQSTLC